MALKRKKSYQREKNKIFLAKDRNNNFIKKKLIKTPSQCDIIVLIGQSNSANAVISDKYPISRHLNYFNKKTYQLSNPVLGCDGDKDNVAPAIADKLKSKKPVIFLTNGWGGTSIYDWSHSKSMLTSYVRNNLKELTKSHLLKYIIWIQGESDNNTDVDYVKEFNLFRENLFKGISKDKYQKSKFIITQTSVCVSDRDEILNKQQKKLAQKNKVFITNVTDNLDLNYRFDQCHYNKFGTEKIAKEISKIINKAS